MGNFRGKICVLWLWGNPALSGLEVSVSDGTGLGWLMVDGWLSPKFRIGISTGNLFTDHLTMHPLQVFSTNSISFRPKAISLASNFNGAFRCRERKFISN